MNPELWIEHKHYFYSLLSHKLSNTEMNPSLPTHQYRYRSMATVGFSSCSLQRCIDACQEVGPTQYSACSITYNLTNPSIWKEDPTPNSAMVLHKTNQFFYRHRKKKKKQLVKQFHSPIFSEYDNFYVADSVISGI